VLFCAQEKSGQTPRIGLHWNDEHEAQHCSRANAVGPNRGRLSGKTRACARRAHLMPMDTNRGFDNAQARWPWTSPTRFCSCGVQSLHHSLLLLGMQTHLARLLSQFPVISNIGFGHEIPDLMRVARRMGTSPENLATPRLRTLKAAIDRSLRSGSPVILGSDAAIHWLVLAGYGEDGNYVWLDSANQDLFGDGDGMRSQTGSTNRTTATKRSPSGPVDPNSGAAPWCPISARSTVF